MKVSQLFRGFLFGTGRITSPTGPPMFSTASGSSESELPDSRPAKTRFGIAIKGVASPISWRMVLTDDTALHRMTSPCGRPERMRNRTSSRFVSPTPRRFSTPMVWASSKMVWTNSAGLMRYSHGKNACKPRPYTFNRCHSFSTVGVHIGTILHFPV